MSASEQPDKSGETSSSSLEDLLLSQMDNAVIEFAKIMGNPEFTFAERFKAGEFVRDWLQRRRKIQAPVDQVDAPNIEELKKAMRDVTLETMAREGVLKGPPKKVGRPTKQEAARKRLLEEARAAEEAEADGDDSQLQKALRSAR